MKCFTSMDVSSIFAAIFFFNLNANNEYTTRIFRRAITLYKLLISLFIGQTIAILKFYFLEIVENKENPLSLSSFLQKKLYVKLKAR